MVGTDRLVRSGMYQGGGLLSGKGGGNRGIHDMSGFWWPGGGVLRRRAPQVFGPPQAEIFSPQWPLIADFLVIS